MAKIYMWNTGAHYTNLGQRLVAVIRPDGILQFEDLDRGISGIAEFEEDLTRYTHNGVVAHPLVKQTVMEAYAGTEYHIGVDQDVARQLRKLGHIDLEGPVMEAHVKAYIAHMEDLYERHRVEAEEIMNEILDSRGIE